MESQCLAERELVLAGRHGATRRKNDIESRGFEEGARVRFGDMIYVVSYVNKKTWRMDLTRIYSNGKIRTLKLQSPFSYVVVTDPSEKDRDGN